MPGIEKMSLLLETLDINKELHNIFFFVHAWYLLSSHLIAILKECSVLMVM
jgi:hypothetical protein